VAAVRVAAAGGTRGCFAAAARVRALGLLVCAPASAAPATRPAAVASATGRCAAAARRPGCDAGGWPGAVR
jgi:hypothetical protein